MRWVIITIIFVFDPLAVLLLIASQYTFEWRRNDKAKDLSNKHEVVPDPVEEDEKDPDTQMEEALQGETFEDVDDQVLEEEYTSDDDGVKGPHLLKDNDIAELLEKADPETLEEVAEALGVEKEVDNETYNPYNDNRDDSELTDDELSARTNMKVYAPDGSLAANRKVTKVTIKNKNKEDI